MDICSGTKKRVLVVDEQVSVREMLAIILSQEHGYTVVGAACTGLDGLRIFRELKPDLIVTELILPKMSGAEMIIAMRGERREPRIMIYSGSRNPSLIREGLAARPHGFVHKTDSLATLYEALAAVERGCSFLTPFATRLLDEPQGVEQSLSLRECSVLKLVAEGLSTKQVAGRLSISPKTVEHYRGQMMQKLDLHDIASLTRYAVRRGLVPES